MNFDSVTLLPDMDHQRPSPGVKYDVSHREIERHRALRWLCSSARAAFSDMTRGRYYQDQEGSLVVHASQADPEQVDWHCWHW